jgi:predicted nuclease of predicted toxin-antitoxin system
VLRFLLDEHLSPEVVSAVQAVNQEISVVSLNHWENSQYRELDDGIVLAKAHEQGLTLVTYDLKTIPPLLVPWGQRGIPHAGVIFGSSNTISTSEIGAIARAHSHVAAVRRSGLDEPGCLFK